MSQVPIVPKPASRSEYAQLEGGDKSDLPVSAPTTLNNELVVGNLSASNDATVPLVIGPGPVISTITTPYKRRNADTVATQMDLLYASNKRNVLRGREHPDRIKWKKSTCTLPSRRCSLDHEGQGFFCNSPIHSKRTCCLECLSRTVKIQLKSQPNYGYSYALPSIKLFFIIIIFISLLLKKTSFQSFIFAPSAFQPHEYMLFLYNKIVFPRYKLFLPTYSFVLPIYKVFLPKKNIV